MFSKLPLDIQMKIQNYIYDIDVSKKIKHFKQVHHELLYGWWYTEKTKNTYHVYSQYSDIPTIITHISLEEIYRLYESECIDWKPFLFYTIFTNKPPIFDYDMTYCFAERIPQLLTLYDETT